MAASHPAAIRALFSFLPTPPPVDYLSFIVDLRYNLPKVWYRKRWSVPFGLRRWLVATAAPISHVANIGDTAGDVWKILDKEGPLTMAKLVKAVGGSRDVVMQALGWLAREGKISIEEDGRSRIVSLR